MSFISYAQNFEDVMLWRALKHIKNGFYIDVGAAWPNEHSVTKAFYLNGWRGINIEPDPTLSQLLKTFRTEDINLRAAVGEQNSRILISFIDDTGLSTVSEQISNFHKESGRVLRQEEIEQIKLADLCKEYLEPDQPIHFLKVDVEGAEEAVLRGNDWNVFRPWILVIEATLPMVQIDSYESWEPILLNANYLFAYADGLNRFYVAKEKDELLDSFRYPPNVFDGFLLGSQYQAEAKAEQAEAKAEQAEAKAEQAEAKAEQAEAKAEKAEAKAEKAEAKAGQLEARLLKLFMAVKVLRKVYAFFRRILWLITALFRLSYKTLLHMRLGSIKTKIKLLIRGGVFYVRRRPRLKNFVLAILNHMPSIKAFFRYVVRLGGVTESYQIHKEPLAQRLLNADSSVSSFNKFKHSAKDKDFRVELKLNKAISNWNKGDRIDK